MKKIIFLSVGIGQFFCALPLEIEMRKRGYFVSNYCCWDANLLWQSKVENLAINFSEFDLIVCTGDLDWRRFFKRENITKKIWVDIFHGCGCKCALYGYVKDNFADYILCPGDIYLDEFKSYKDKNINPDAFTSKTKLLIGGFPKSDYLIQNITNKQFFRKQLINKFKLNPNLPIVSYSPTWSHEKSCSNTTDGTIYHFEEIYKQIQKLNVNFIVTFHPGDIWRNNINLVLNNFNNLNIEMNPNKNDLLLGLDLILTDNSSIGYEAALANVKVVHLVNSNCGTTMKLFTRPWEQDTEIGPILKLPEDYFKIPEIVYNYICNKIQINENWLFWLKKCSGACDGTSTTKCAILLENILKKEL